MSRYLDEQSEYLMERNGTYGTYPGRVMDVGGGPRGILRKPSDNYLRPWTAHIPQTHSFASETSEPTTGCGLFLDGFVRPAVAEFLAVFTTIFMYLQFDAELSQRHITSMHRFSLLAFVDAITALAFIAAFRTVHLNPSISIAQLFSLSTSWFICGVLFLCQIAASVLAIAAHHALRPSAARLPLATYVNDVSSDASTAVYRMIVCQMIATVILVLSHLLCTVSLTRRGGSFRLGSLKGSPLSLFLSIGLSSLINLMMSSLNWNPLLALAISLYRFTTGDGKEAFTTLHLYFLGPVIGSLLACFLFRVLFTNDDRRLFRCGDNEPVSC